MEKAVFEFVTTTKSDLVNRKIVNTTLSIGSDIITQLEVNPWDVKSIKNVKRKNKAGDAWVPLGVIDSLEDVEQVKLQTFSDNDPAYVYIEGTTLKVLPVPTLAHEIQIYYEQITPLIGVDDLTTITLLDNEGDLVLAQWAEAYYLENQSNPKAAKAFMDAKDVLQRYQGRNNGLSKRRGRAGRLRVRQMAGDRNL